MENNFLVSQKYVLLSLMKSPNEDDALKATILRGMNTKPDINNYIFRVCKEYSIPGDFLYALAKFAYPDFKRIGRMIVLADKYSDEQYQQYLGQKMGDADIEAWFNLVNIDCYFADGVDAKVISDFGDIICALWKLKLEKEFPDERFEVGVLEDEGEYFLHFTHLGGWSWGANRGAV